MLHAFYQNTRNTLKNITRSQLNHPSLLKWSTICTSHDLDGSTASYIMVPSRLMFTKSVTVSLAVSNMGVVLIKHRSESQWTVLLGYVTISTNVRCSYRVIYNNFVIQQDSAPVHLAFNTIQLLQCKTLNFLSPELWHHNSPEINSTDDEIQNHIAAWAWVTSIKTEQIKPATCWSLAMQNLNKRMLFLSFFISPGSAEALVRWGGKTK